jgi:imidazoleglycerol-phosphate dehydratase
MNLVVAGKLLMDNVKQIQNGNGNLNQYLEIHQINKIIVDIARQIQKSNGYSDPEMAELIGCRRTTYNLIKNERKLASGVFCRGLLMYLVNNNGKELSATKHEGSNNGERYYPINRKTKETDISGELNIDGSGKWQIKTGIKMFDHLLSQLAQHGRFDLKLAATGDDQHHLIEDVAICLGQAFIKALGEKRGITRMGNATVPMDDALAMVAVDISGRGYTMLELNFSQNSAKWQLLGFPPDLIRHFLESFAIEAKLNLNASVTGKDDHHKAEAVFKALGRALHIATRIDPRIAVEIPSTKGLLES